MAYQFIKRYQNFYGIDRKSNDLQFPERYATEAVNLQAMKTGTLEKRAGYQPVAGEGAKFGTFVYTKFDPVSGAEAIEMLGASSTVNKRNTVTLSITYTGGNPTCLLSILFDPDTNVYRCQVFVGAAFVLDTSLGLGFDEPSTKTITQLAAEIAALPGFSASVSGLGSTPAAFLEIQFQEPLSSTARAVNAYYWTALKSTLPTLLAGSETNKNAIDFENVSSVQLQNCIYFSNGYDEVIKYDGNMLYRAGVPTPASLTASSTGGTGNTYVYRAQYVQVDAAGNSIDGNIFDAATLSNVGEPSVNSINVTVANVQPSTGFNTGCAIIGAVSSGTTITVASGHTLTAGDTIYLWDTTLPGSYVTRKVLSVGLTTITVDSSVAVTNAAGLNVISANLRIRLLRNAGDANPTLWFILAEIPNNSLVGTQVYTDTASNNSLVIEFVEPATDRSPPVKGKYISQFQNLMVTAGSITAPLQVSFSDVENAEYFPIPDNQIIVQNRQGDRISGISPSAENFIVFHNRSTHAVTGDVAEGNFRVDLVSQDLGCVSHHSIAQVRGALMFLSEVGPRMMIGATIPKAIGAADENPLASRIDPDFEQRSLPAEAKFTLKRSIGFHDQLGEKYFLFVPVMKTTGGNRYCSDQSIIYVYDYTRDSWWTWDNINFGSGIVSIGKDVFFSENAYSDYTANLRYIVYKFSNTGTALDYQDNNEPIEILYSSPWEFMGQASVLKTFSSIRIFSTEAIGGQFTLGIDVETNFAAGTSVSTCTINSGTAGYGLGEYSSAAYGDPSDSAPKHKLSVGRVRAARMLFSNAEEQTNIAITGYELELATPYKAEFKT